MTRWWVSRWAITACMVVAACGGTPGASGIPAASQQTETTSPSAAAAAAPTPTLVAGSPPSPTPRREGLFVGGFARITVAELNVRTAPSLAAAQLMEGNADAEPTPVRWGTKRGADQVFVFDGPVDADGYQWWQVFPTVYDDDGVSRPAPYAPSGPDIGWV